jgi:hypothetical protein
LASCSLVRGLAAQFLAVASHPNSLLMLAGLVHDPICLVPNHMEAFFGCLSKLINREILAGEFCFFKSCMTGVLFLQTLYQSRTIVHNV